MFLIRLVATRLLLAFALAQIFGLLVGTLFMAQEISVVENPADPANALRLFGGILVSTLLLLLILKFYKGDMLFRILEAFLIFSTVDLFFALVMGEETIAFWLAIGFLFARYLFSFLAQALIIFSTVVVGSLLGSSLDFLPVVLFVVLLAGYDFVAVFVTKHMVTLAKALENRKNTLTVGFTHKKEKVHLGTGDFVVPVVFCVSVLKTFGLGPAILSGLGATFGLAVLLWVMEKRRGYYPALPPIVLGCLLGVALSLAAKAVFGSSG